MTLKEQIRWVVDNNDQYEQAASILLKNHELFENAEEVKAERDRLLEIVEADKDQAIERGFYD